MEYSLLAPTAMDRARPARGRREEEEVEREGGRKPCVVEGLLTARRTSRRSEAEVVAMAARSMVCVVVACSVDGEEGRGGRRLKQEEGNNASDLWMGKMVGWVGGMGTGRKWLSSWLSSCHGWRTSMALTTACKARQEAG